MIVGSPNRRVFSRNVDKRSRKAMTDYLRNHFRYCTANSWNRSTSYACNMKIHSLGLDHDTVEKLYDLVQVPEFYDRLQPLLQAFGEQHDFLWQAGWNGRSGGYLVLYQGGRRASEYRSYCTSCGQRNYRSVEETGTRCGRCGEDARVDFESPPMEIFAYPGRGTDMDNDFEDWDLYDLRQRTELVQQFDCLADAVIAKALDIVGKFSVREQTVYVPRKELILV